HDAEDARRPVGQVDLAAPLVGSAVVDRDHHGATVEQVRDPDLAPERERAVGAGQLEWVEELAARGRTARELPSVPRSVSDDGFGLKELARPGPPRWPRIDPRRWVLRSPAGIRRMSLPIAAVLPEDQRACQSRRPDSECYPLPTRRNHWFLG